MITKPLHLSQKPPKYYEDGTVEIRIKVIPNNELERLILSYGSGIEVLEPIELRERIAKNNKNKRQIHTYANSFAHKKTIFCINKLKT